MNGFFFCEYQTTVGASMISKVMEEDGMTIELQVQIFEFYNMLVLGYSWSETVSEFRDKFVSWS